MVSGTKRKKVSGLSSCHRVSYGSKPAPKSIALNKTGSQIQKESDKLTGQITALSFLQREQLFGQGDYNIEMPDAPEYYPADGWQDIDSDEEAAIQTLPPGEEGLYHSHAGKDAVFNQIFEKCRPGYIYFLALLQKMVDAWKEQMPCLVDAYLALGCDGPLNSDENPLTWTIQVIGFEGITMHRFAHADDVQRTNETLVRHGYIGASPEKVSLAFPLHLFEVYRQIHQVCPRYSLGALSRTLTNLAEAPQISNLAEQLSTAYDAYLEVMRRVDACAHLTMGRDAACMDGNNSLKLVEATFRTGSLRADNDTSTSFRWLTPPQVDVFKDEVADAQRVRASRKKNATQPPAIPATTAPPATVEIPTVVPDAESPASSRQEEDHSDHEGEADADRPDGDIAWLNVNELSGAEAEELSKCLNTCVERWKAAGPEARKKMFALFAITGIFLTVCRHGHVLVIMKYPLAMVRFLLENYGADIGLGYDIMCAFWKTLRRSSLGADVTAMRLQGVIPAFHRHAHNRACQIGWHPLYVEGVGLEDFEECEHTFSLSNHLASSTRLAAAFHRQQKIDEHFQFHDQDKHASSGNFIFQNYRQALEKIALNREQLSELERSLGFGSPSAGSSSSSIMMHLVLLACSHASDLIRARLKAS
ncbi:hypothetical protein DFH09DRAFT_1281614 [Mycena vulgaris]|nr:hypothetical protein DFH09DRAFT_1281614 [Mycena vulgaris]